MTRAQILALPEADQPKAFEANPGEVMIERHPKCPVCGRRYWFKCLAKNEHHYKCPHCS